MYAKPVQQLHWGHGTIKIALQQLFKSIKSTKTLKAESGQVSHQHCTHCNTRDQNVTVWTNPLLTKCCNLKYCALHRTKYTKRPAMNHNNKSTTNAPNAIYCFEEEKHLNTTVKCLLTKSVAIFLRWSSGSKYGGHYWSADRCTLSWGDI